MVQDPKAARGKEGSSSAEIAVTLLFEFAASKPESIRRILLAFADAGVCPMEDVPSAASVADGSGLLTFILLNQAVLSAIFTDAEFVAYFRARFPEIPSADESGPVGRFLLAGHESLKPAGGMDPLTAEAGTDRTARDRS